MSKLLRPFYDRPTLDVARDLLGKYLVHTVDGVSLVCKITETEGYIGRLDKACHAYDYRRTARTEILFGRPGTAYIYLIYGMYDCLNFVTEGEGEPCAVLLRAGIPTPECGDAIAHNRFGRPMADMTAYQRKNFLNGPGKLCRGLRLSRKENGMDLTGDELFVWDAGDQPPAHINVGKRIGIDYAEEAADFPWRFWI